MRKFLIIFMCLIFAGLVTSTTVLAVKYSAEINKTEEIQPTDTSGLVNTIEELQKLVKDLTAEKSELQVKADNLTAQNESLQAQISALQSQVNVDAETIQDLQQQLADNEALINDLNSQITALESSISYYEDYIQRFENENQVTATFVVDNEVVATPILLVGDKLTPPAVESTETKTFDGWLVNDELIDIDTYTITEDTRFVAKFSYSYYATFMVDDAQLTEVLIPERELLFNYLPTEPTKEGFIFRYWTVNNIEISSDFIITADTILNAVFIEIPSNGTYKFVLWHPNITVQEEVSLFGNNVTEDFDISGVTSCVKSTSGLITDAESFSFDGHTLKIKFGICKPAMLAIYYFYFSIELTYSEDSDSFSITSKKIYYSSSGSNLSIFTALITTGGTSDAVTDISSGTTITFKEVV